MVFASDSAIQILLRAEMISVDKTFTSCPPPFAQHCILIATLPQGSGSGKGCCPTRKPKNLHQVLPDSRRIGRGHVQRYNDFKYQILKR
jgi:hypothetical protein